MGVFFLFQGNVKYLKLLKVAYLKSGHDLLGQFLFIIKGEENTFDCAFEILAMLISVDERQSLSRVKVSPSRNEPYMVQSFLTHFMGLQMKETEEKSALFMNCLMLKERKDCNLHDFSHSPSIFICLLLFSFTIHYHYHFLCLNPSFWVQHFELYHQAVK